MFLPLILVFLIIIGIPVLLSFLIYMFIKRKNYDKRLRLIALLPILIVSYLIYTAIYPGEDFYRTEFIEVAGIELPDEAEFRYKSATYPDFFFGDYTSVSIIDVGEDFYNQLPKALAKKGLSENGETVSTEEFDKALEYTDNLKIAREFSIEEGGGVYYYIGFLTDKQTIIVQRLSW